MTNEKVNFLWIVFWIIISAGWSLISFKWLRKSIEEIPPVLDNSKSFLTRLLLRRIAVFLIIGLLFFLALRTEPIAVVGMAFTMTITTWVQIIFYNAKLNKQARGVKEK